MKQTTFLFILFISLKSFSQKIETYYDYNWQPCDPLVARFYSVAEKTDSGWLRHDYFLSNKHLQMEALFEDSACKIYNGRGIFFYPNGQVSQIGRMIHNKKEGICVSYYSNGMMSDSANYHNNIPTGYKLQWHSNGFLSDSIAHINDSTDVKVSWFDNGQPNAAGILLNGKMHGKWKYFHQNGNVASIEIYDQGRLLSKKHYDETGTLQADTSKDKPAAFERGMDGWRQYLENKLYWPVGYKFDNGDMAVVVIELTINEDGKVADAEVVTPFHPAFDQIALRTIQLSPKWQAAIEHNRPVKYHFRQSVTFQQPE